MAGMEPNKELHWKVRVGSAITQSGILSAVCDGAGARFCLVATNLWMI